MKTVAYRRKNWPPALRRKVRQAAYEFHVRAFGGDLAKVNFQSLAKCRRCVAAMVDHALRNGVKFEKPVLGVTP